MSLMEESANAEPQGLMGGGKGAVGPNAAPQPTSTSALVKVSAAVFPPLQVPGHTTLSRHTVEPWATVYPRPKLLDPTRLT